MATEINYKETLIGVAHRIEALNKDFPQLKGFSAVKNTSIENMNISYEYHTHWPQHRGGWRSGVPEPDADGIWFYLDFHDPDSSAQIHTQPLVRKMCLENKIAFLLILEGKDTKPVVGAIWKIMENYGAKPCEPYKGSDI